MLTREKEEKEVVAQRTWRHDSCRAGRFFLAAMGVRSSPRMPLLLRH